MRTAKIITRVAEVAANNRFSPQRRKLGYFAVILQVSEIIKTAKMNDTYNFGNSHCYVCITRPAPWRA